MSSGPEGPAGRHAIRRVVFDAPTIARRVEELGREITAAYSDGDLLLIGMLKGSFVFLADLIRAIQRPLHVDFVVASSYGGGKVSSGQVVVHYRPQTPVEDIIDSGRTLSALAAVFSAEGARSLEVCALLHKGKAPAAPAVRFLGFTAPDTFLVGYGLDYAEDYRHLPYVADLD
jgi:hypoxanthine phosphoribosyltransferase